MMFRQFIFYRDNTAIILNAFERFRHSNTIRLEGFINQQPVSVLVDVDSTHNFMQEEVANALKLTIHAISPFKVLIGSGKKLLCTKDCKVTQIHIQGIMVVMDLFLLPMGGSNIVIGIQWLKKLGYFSLSFEILSMQFT